MTNEQIDGIFRYHAPHGDQAYRYEQLRAEARKLAMSIVMYAPDSRERSLAITHVQQAVMWANAAIAINERDPSTTETQPSTTP